MAVKLRLSRAGSKKRPYYHIVAADEHAPRDGRFLEQLGRWNPMLPKGAERVHLKEERIKVWLDHGAQPTDRVARFLDAAGMATRAPRNNPFKAKPGKKAQERAEERRQKEEAAKGGATNDGEAGGDEARAG